MTRTSTPGCRPYLIPSEGGEPVRLTWHPSTDIVLGWTPDGTKVIFKSTGETPSSRSSSSSGFVAT
jgi:tricorn protease